MSTRNRGGRTQEGTDQLSSHVSLRSSYHDLSPCWGRRVAHTTGYMFRENLYCIWKLSCLPSGAPSTLEGEIKLVALSALKYSPIQ